ncbi:MAG: YgiQ family radical SAM protein [Elusimicrobiota bacterium]|jgi:uncharacterized radical SAM protein YgiQ|nr:YgiQ family radical SAM protein [Elusimicrobiota bacterium]
MFLPTTKEEMQKLGWDKPDIILISGDTYIDSPFIGAAVIGNFLYSKGFKTAIIAQPNTKTDDIARLGEPRLFWGVTAGAMDSLVSNWTALNKFRNDDDLTAGAINNRRPDRASMAYTNLIRRYFKNTKPIVLGGVEASLRRIAHYDFKDNALRRSILFDSKADILIYGMGEKTTWELAEELRKIDDSNALRARLKQQTQDENVNWQNRRGRSMCLPFQQIRDENAPWQNIKGLCYISKTPQKDALEIASFEKCMENKDNFLEAFNTFYKNCISENEKTLIQKHNDRYLIHNPKQPILKMEELDEIYDLPYTREVHPFYAKFGKVKAQDTIKFSITSHRGCFGECNFCSIAVHQGKVVVSRSEKSIIKEAQSITQLKDFKGYISDAGGPTANMLYAYCKKHEHAGCEKNRCLFPEACQNLIYGHDKQIEILKKISALDNVKKVFVSSGIRYDMICADKENGQKYLEEISKNHISGQMKIAPEHFNDKVLELMGKPSAKNLNEFKDNFKKASNGAQFLTYYFIAAYPGCSQKEMQDLQNFIKRDLKLRPEQVQIFTPTPSTIAALFYYCEKDLNGAPIFVEKDRNEKQKQKRMICG